MWLVVVEPYFDGSHRAWAEGFRDHSRHDVDLVTHRGSFWKWRMQGAALTLADDLAGLVGRRGRRPDAVVVSDMVHVAALRGLASASLGPAPVVAYFHENQLTYPLAPGALPDVGYGMANWLSMAAADETWFNSAFHLTEMRRAVPVLLGAMPDHRHGDHVERVFARARVLPVGITATDAEPAVPTDAPIVLWNQRWEHDKDPGRFFAAIDRAVDRGRELRLAVAGQSFRVRPAEFERAQRHHRDRIVHFGEAEPAAYRELLARSHVVVSTARHEFFGVAVAEAVAAGCIPVLPDALAYPELLGEAHATWLYGSDEELDELLDTALGVARAGGGGPAGLARSVRERFAWPAVAGRYDDRLEELAAG